MSRIRITGVLGALGVLACAPPVASQAPGTTVGVVGGYTVTDHAWEPDFDTQNAGGLVLGAVVDAQTPLEWLSAGVELTYTQRGSDVLLDSEDPPTPGGIRADYLSLAVRVRANVSVSRFRFHAVAGPLMDFLVRSRLDPVLGQLMREERQAPFGALVGAGVGFWVAEGVLAEVEGRFVEGLQAAYRGDLFSVKHRSREIVARVAIPVVP